MGQKAYLPNTNEYKDTVLPKVHDFLYCTSPRSYHKNSKKLSFC